jgi:hypothetical protein
MAYEWNLPRTANERLATQTAVGLETVLPDVIARMKIKNEPLAGIAQLTKVLADICGATNKVAPQAGPTEKFKIVIDLGGDKQDFDVKRPVVTIEAGAETGGSTEAPSEVSSLREGLSNLLTLQTEPEKA